MNNSKLSTAAAKARASIRARASTIAGKQSEEAVAGRLRGLGLVCVERIETKVAVQRTKGPALGARHAGKVTGDYKAVVPVSGRAVHVEVKRRSRSTLRVSDFKPHQITALDAHLCCGALALVAWHRPGYGIAVMVWPPLPLTSGRSITWADAEKAAWAGVGAKPRAEVITLVREHA